MARRGLLWPRSGLCTAAHRPAPGVSSTCGPAAMSWRATTSKPANPLLPGPPAEGLGPRPQVGGGRGQGSGVLRHLQRGIRAPLMREDGPTCLRVHAQSQASTLPSGQWTAAYASIPPGHCPRGGGSPVQPCRDAEGPAVSSARWRAPIAMPTFLVQSRSLSGRRPSGTALSPQATSPPRTRCAGRRVCAQGPAQPYLRRPAGWRRSDPGRCPRSW